MKKRDYKKFSEGTIYHIYNRGNNKERIYLDDQDYRSFLFRLGLAFGIKLEILNKNEMTKSPRSRIRISTSPDDIFRLHAFCLMPNHFHILIEQCGKSSISQLMHKVCTSFSMYMNKKYKRVGHIFQDRFKSVTVENNSQLMWVTSYIHTNPVKDKVVNNPYEYKWSSYNDYANDRNLHIVYKDLINSIFGDKENFIKQNFVPKENMSRRVLDE